MNQLNRSDQVLLFSELNSYLLSLSGADSPSPFSAFAERFNLRKEQEGNTRQKGSYIPNPSSFHTTEQLFDTFGRDYLYIGEKIAFDGYPIQGKYPPELFFSFQMKHYFNAYHLFLLRRPSETLLSQFLLHPHISLADHFACLLRSFERIFEMSWVFPRARLAFYERLGEDAFREIFAWLKIDWSSTPRIHFAPKERKDWALRRPELFREIPGLAQLENVYEQLVRAAQPDTLFFRRDGEGFQRSNVYDLIASALRRLVRDHDNGTLLNAACSVASPAIGRAGGRITLETLHPSTWPEPQCRHYPPQLERGLDISSFIRKVLALYPGRQVQLLDLDAHGGQLIEHWIESGHFAIGLQRECPPNFSNGSSVRELSQGLLFCDSSYPFELFWEYGPDRTPLIFDVITAWEFLERLPEEQLPILLENVRKHLNPDTGLFIVSISFGTCGSQDAASGVTIKPEWWWRSFFLDHKFYPVDIALRYFGFQLELVTYPAQDQPEILFLVLTLCPDSAIVRQINRMAIENRESAEVHFRNVQAQLAEERILRFRAQRDLSRVSCALAEVQKERDLLQEALTRYQAYNWPNLCGAAARAIETCRMHGFRAVAFFGAGGHTRRLLPLWRALGGPPVVAILTSEAGNYTVSGLPLYRIGETLPNTIEAIVPSSHSFEAHMRKEYFRHRPHAAWVPLWESPSYFCSKQR